MIITTTDELRLHLPNHAYDDLDSMTGAFRRSEADVLVEKIGKPLYNAMIEKYETINPADAHEWLVHTGRYNNEKDVWADLVYLCQQVVVFDAFGRSADINAVSINQSGINVVDADNYDVASKDFITAYKKQMSKEMHASVNRLLVWLEELNAVLPDEGQVSEEESDAEQIVELWKKSKFYYQVAGLFVSTATKFNEYVDIYESRERFVSLVPDLKYCQRHYIVNELGEPLAADLLEKLSKGQGNAVEKKTIEKIEEALCLCVETRSDMFKRKEAKDEAVGAVKQMVDYISANQSQYDAEAIKSFPGYIDPTIQQQQQPSIWENNRPGNVMLVTPVIY